MEKIENVKDIARPQIFFENSKTPQCTSLIKENGQRTNSNKEVIETLMKKHFPDCRISEISDFTEPTQRISSYDNESTKQINDLINKERIVSALKSFGPFKTPGKDEIMPALLQKVSDTVSRLEKIL